MRSIHPFFDGGRWGGGADAEAAKRAREFYDKSLAGLVDRKQGAYSNLMRFTDDAIEMEDDGQPSGKVDWTNIKSLEDQGDWLRLIFRNDAGELYLRKQDFTVGTAAEFQSWLAEVHSEISQTSGKKA